MVDNPRSLNNILSRANYNRQNTMLSAPVSLVDPDLDLQWSNAEGAQPRTPHTYFDYVFTGQDVLAYIEGSEPEECIPVVEMGFNIEQQKVPVFGFWDYTFAAVMRGTRTISGLMRIATVSTNYMTDRIADSATSRAAKLENLNPIRGLDRDEKNIEEYWSRNIDTSAGYNEGGKAIFSAHPPFNLCVDFQMQSVSVNESPVKLAETLYQKYNRGPANIQNYNERLVDTDIDDTMHYVLENVELVNMGTEFSPAGEVVGESYSFFARDLRTPRV